MLDLPKNSKARLVFLISICLISSYFVVAFENFIYIFGIMVGLTILLIFTIKNPINFIKFALLIRPSLDILGNYKLMGVVNAAGILSLFVILICLFIFLKENNIRILFGIRTNIIYALIIGSIISTISNYQYIDYNISLIDFIMKMLSAVSIFLVLIDYMKTYDRVIEIVKTVMLSALFPIFFGFFCFVTDFNTIPLYGVPYINRIMSTFVHPNNFGHYLLVVFFYYQINRQFELKEKWIFGRMFFILLLLNILFTFSRSSIIGLLCGYLIVKIKNVKSLIFSIFAVSLTFLLFYYQYTDFFDYTFEYTLQSDYADKSTLYSRVYVWYNSFSMIFDSFFWGYGVEYFLKIFGTNAHNDYLRVFFELGLSGFVLVCSLFFFQIKDSMHLMKSDKKLNQEIGKIYMANIITILLIMSVGNLIFSLVIQWYVYGLWAIVLSLKNIQRSNCKRMLYNSNS